MVDGDQRCCAGSRTDDQPPPGDVQGDGGDEAILSTAPATANDNRTDRMVRLEGGTFTMGTNSDVGFEADGEGPARNVSIDSFYVDNYAVTVAEFFQFVRETGYTTDAERYGWSFVFHDFVHSADADHVIENVDAAPWWVAVEGAAWFTPYGPSSTVLENRSSLKHPVTQVSWRDAQAYAEWAGKRLPTEAEWEYAAQGEKTGTQFPWGDCLEPSGEHRCNVWQGKFPEHNTGDDGYRRTAPVNAFEPNDYGLYNVVGNVWEWCTDWFSPNYHTTPAYDPDNPTGPDDGTKRVMKGGSHLCHESWCNRYRLPARSKNTPDSATTNIGFRCVVDA